MIMQTLCATGIRISELRYITVESLITGTVVIQNKGKIREIIIPNKLKRLLTKYAEKLEAQLVGNQLTFKTNQFSTYALVYDDTKTITNTTETVETKDTTNVGTLYLLLSVSLLTLLGTIYTNRNTRKQS